MRQYCRNWPTFLLYEIMMNENYLWTYFQSKSKKTYKAKRKFYEKRGTTFWFLNFFHLFWLWRTTQWVHKRESRSQNHLLHHHLISSSFPSKSDTDGFLSDNDKYVCFRVEDPETEVNKTPLIYQKKDNDAHLQNNETLQVVDQRKCCHTSFISSFQLYEFVICNQ